MSHAPAVPEAMATAMAGLAVGARVSLGEQVDAVEAVAVRALHSPVPADDPERADALRCAHRVAGTAGAFGWHATSALLLQAEAVLDADGPLDVDGAVSLCEVVMAAREDLARPPVLSEAVPQQQTVSAFAPLEPLEPPRARAEAPAATTPTVDVVVVEDDLILGALLCQVVADLGLSVQHCEDGISALGLLAGVDPLARPRMILLDIDLPGRSGLSVLRVLQRDQVTASAAVVMLSSRSGIDDRELATQLGASSFLSKPFAIRDVTDHLQRLVRAP